MRIAAKRLRYALELMGFCLGPYAAKAARRVRELQDVIGAIHDCDVLQPQVHGEIAALRAADARELAAAVLHNGGGEPAPSSRTRRATYGALEALAVDQQARRAVLFAQFLKQWAALERSGFREKLQAALVTAPADSA
jgi:CHAD domain-containing protein